MNELFKFSKRNNTHKTLRIVAKIMKIIHIIFAGIFALISIIYISYQYSDGSYLALVLLALFITVIGFFLILFIGWVIELLLLGFSNIVENQYDELVLKNKGEKIKVTFNRNSNNLYDRLQQLFNLKNAGIITEEEYKQKKADTLKELG